MATLLENIDWSFIRALGQRQQGHGYTMYYFILQDRRLLQPKASLPQAVAPAHTSESSTALGELEEPANECGMKTSGVQLSPPRPGLSPGKFQRSFCS